jgi:ketosteroid isomerase-like protein
MESESDPASVDRRFFAALIAGEVETLKQILADDFILVDIMSGGEVDRPALLAVVGSGQLRFHRIDPVECRVRHYPPGTAVVNGRTEMSGEFAGAPFAASSRYTHVYVRLEDDDDDGGWRLVAAQGTRIA